MLTELRISGLGVIDQAVAEFAPGLTVLTGETGAGKTMVVTGLRLLAGGRADPSRVRRGCERAIVEGRFEFAAVPPGSGIGTGVDGGAGTGDDPTGAAVAEVTALLEDQDVELDEDGSVIAVRRVGADGRSRARLGGRPVPAGVLARFCAPVLAVHGQNDQLRLLRPDRQLAAVDTHGGEACARARADYDAAHRRWRAAEQAYAEVGRDARETAREADMLTLGLEEIDAVDPRPGEEDELSSTIRRLTESEALREVALYGHELLAGGADEREPVVATLDGLATRLRSADDPRLTELAEQVEQAVSVLGATGTELGLYLADFPEDTEVELDRLIGRRQALRTLTRKYGADLESVIEWAGGARARLAGLVVSDEDVERLRGEVEHARSEVARTGGALTAARRAAAADLAERVSAELSELSMGGATVVVELRPAGGAERPQPTESGLDEAEFGLAGPAGTVPLAKGASGGELSRVMLALEVVLSARSGGGTLVFDEVDAGVGGRAALSIGRRLAALGRRNQVIAVTHLAQVAAYADTHLSVRKSAADEGLVSGVAELEGEDRITELARMLAGMEDTDTGLAHAQELLERAREEIAEM